jgi:hypothetical protein
VEEYGLSKYLHIAEFCAPTFFGVCYIGIFRSCEAWQIMDWFYKNMYTALISNDLIVTSKVLAGNYFQYALLALSLHAVNDFVN